MLYNKTNLIAVTGSVATEAYLINNTNLRWIKILNPMLMVILAIMLILLIRQIYRQIKGEKTINK